MTIPKELQEYFTLLNEKTKEAHEIAKQARSKGYDPSRKPEIQIAKNMAERVVGMVSVVAPQLADSGLAERIQELEREHGVLDWRVAFKVALETAQQKFCSFQDEREAMEVGIRVGFTYATNGVVSSPLEGFVGLELKDRNDKKGKFFRVNYAGPVRNAGGTAAAVSVLIADYVRKHMGYAEYDPTPDEIKRCYVEITNYHERVTNLQYYPSEAEIEFLVSNMPVEVAGDPTEKIEVSNYKNLPRVPTNKIRSGYCLIYSACIPLKAPKLWKQLGNWGEEMGMEQWAFLEKFIKIQKKAAAKGEKAEHAHGITPNYTYIADLVAGRPVFGHPLRPGGFRLRYGRSRISGMSGQSLHPATTIIANEFIATGSQLKVERPGKAAAYTVCEELEGPIVKLKNGEVLQLRSSEEARRVKDHVEKILFLGDVLINYGDFLDRAHVLVPPGYCEEWWVQELKKAGYHVQQHLWDDPIKTEVSFDEALQYSKEFSIPLHPKHTFYYNIATPEQLSTLWTAIKKAPPRENLILPNKQETKEVLETIGAPHKVVQEESLVLTGDSAKALRYCFSRDPPGASGSAADFMNAVSPVILRDKAGCFIGSRLGRPEKAKMRKLTGSPHGLFPCGNEGGRLRSINAALEVGHVKSSFELFWCPKCEQEVVLPSCPVCETRAERRYWCRTCGTTTKDSCNEGPHRKYKEVSVPLRDYLDFCLRKMQSRVYPDLIKGIRGTSNEDHATEHLMKGVLRARHEVYVNKDGTVRYDASEVPVTHFRPKEIGISVTRVKNLGYIKDIHGKPITREDQVIELFPQDVILPDCEESPDEGVTEVLMNVANFVDELLVQLYELEPYYKAKTYKDLIGHFVVALAPHTSAGTIGRIIGFTKTQGLFYHPYLHAATRRDCDGDEGCIFLLMDAFLNFSKRYLPSTRGATMDAPLVLTTVLAAAEVDDMVLNVDTAWRYPLEFYEACQEWKMPWEVHIPTLKDRLGSDDEFHSMGFTHDTPDMNDGNRCSAYKLLPSMQEKLESQMDLAKKLVSVDEKDVAKLVIEKHFIRDIKGNLRKFSQQAFRCVKCNESFRRPPLRSVCKCGGRIIFTISEGSIVKYLSPAESLVKAYELDKYLAQTIELTRRRVEEVFGRDSETQKGLGEWFS